MRSKRRGVSLVVGKLFAPKLRAVLAGPCRFAYVNRAA
jgi:hypothetical protein